MSRSLAIAILAVAALLWLGGTAWTVRRLWRPGETPYTRIVYSLGVRRFGLGFWVLFTVFFTLQSDGTSLSALLRALLTLFLGLPISLWGGYVWGRGMALFYGFTDQD